MTATDDLSVTAKTLAHHGALIAGNAISLDAARQTLNGAINATGDITVSGETIATSRHRKSRENTCILRRNRLI